MYFFNITCVMYGIFHMRSDGNSAVKIEGGGGQRLYLYTVKIANFRQILMSSLTKYFVIFCVNYQLIKKHFQRLPDMSKSMPQVLDPPPPPFAMSFLFWETLNLLNGTLLEGGVYWVFYGRPSAVHTHYLSSKRNWTLPPKTFRNSLGTVWNTRVATSLKN